MRSIIVDSGPLIALFNGSDRHHRQALAFIRNVDRPLVTNLPVIGEVMHMLDFNRHCQQDFLGWVHEAAEIDTRTVDDFPRILTVLEKYADLPADFADASLVALCERRKCNDIASVDSDFTIYRSKTGAAFNNHFFN